MLSAGKTHLVEAFRWSAQTRAETAETIAAGLGMSAPVLLGAVTGHLNAGLAATLLTHLAGWQYTLRLVLGLSGAEVLRCQWPNHHLHWIALTVAILTPKTIEAVPVKITQRALGTAIGVCAASLFMAFEFPPWALVVTIGVLAGARPLLKAKNYLAYSVIMTPLIILIMDAGHPPDNHLLVERLVSTLIGAMLVVIANLLFLKLTQVSRTSELPTSLTDRT